MLTEDLELTDLAVVVVIPLVLAGLGQVVKATLVATVLTVMVQEEAELVVREATPTRLILVMVDLA